MNAEDLKKYSSMDLLGLHVDALKELRARGVLRSENPPAGDLAEFLFCKAFGWRQAENSEKGFDAEDRDGIRYQIKARRPHQHNTSRQLSAIRDLDGFQILAAVLFDEQFNVTRAALIPQTLVHQESKFIARTNSYKFMLVDAVWTDKRVKEVTQVLKDCVVQEMS
ncbi:MAG: hypothetical protein OXE94_04500 [Aestuariivita sp.]|nr:hypothetical protein [Aestuariivita sp.]MCY4201514.1 hypothetical protein [Aestuariivita sp.]